MPFLGPAIVLWITLSAGVLACYFLFVAPGTDRAHPTTRSRTYEAPIGPVEPPEAARPRPTLPSYDMEDFPTERWGTS